MLGESMTERASARKLPHLLIIIVSCYCAAAMALTFGVDRGGWVRYETDYDPPFWLRLRPDERGRLQAVALYLEPAPRGLGARVLRQVPLTQAMGIANDVAVRELILEAIDEPGPDTPQRTPGHRTIPLDRAGPRIDVTLADQGTASDALQVQANAEPALGTAVAHDATVSTTSHVGIDDELIAVHRQGLAVSEQRVSGVASGRKGPARKTDEFYRQLAAAYSSATRQSRRPAIDLAEANGVPVRTVHRWIAEARKRGFLPPGQKGRRG